MTMGLKFNDTDEKYALEIRRGVVQLHSKLPSKVDVTIVTKRDYLNRILVGDIPITGEMITAMEAGDPAPRVAIMAAIDNGEIKLERGTKQAVQKFFSYFDRPVDPGTINLIVR